MDFGIMNLRDVHQKLNGTVCFHVSTHFLLFIYKKCVSHFSVFQSVANSCMGTRQQAMVHDSQ
jgi:hypothetical protein